MFYENIFSKIKKYHQRLNGSTIEYDLSSYQMILNEINQLKSEFENKSDEQLKSISHGFIKRARNQECLDDFLVEAYALVREVIWRVLKLRPFDVQIIGGIAMHQGKLAEMQTGEGKTLTAVFPAYLNALSGEGVHVLTFNDYLARRDAKWMGPVYEFLGLRVGFVQEGMSIEDRQKAYRSDITYLTAKEAGFDFLRDSLCYDLANMVHRDFYYAIIDEADSILIDEARVPLIIAGASDEFVTDTFRMAQIARGLQENIDFQFDEYARNIFLSDQGLKRVENLLNCSNLYDDENFGMLIRLNCAIHAEYLLHRDIDYIVRNDKVELVDEFTGRIADKRRWPDGLQAAIEAKENIAVQSKGNILNSITLQHFIQLYPKISGMTATAQSAEQEFREFYNLDIVVIPPNKTCIRKDHPDIIFQTKADKHQSLINEIVEVHKTKRPILVGTSSVAESVMLADDLKKQGVTCEVLNAKRDEYEAQIITEAGKLGAVTISTNMAGRGTDIRLGCVDEGEKEQVAALGGLYVIGTNKHESQRIDRQLRGRAGRQGDPGSSRFFISMEDDLFVKYRLKDLLPFQDASAFATADSSEIKNPLVNKEINRIQRIIEGQNLEIKKTVCKYSALVEQQRRMIFEKRMDILMEDSIHEFYQFQCPDHFQSLIAKIGKQQLLKICTHISLFYLDQFWSSYLAEIADIREGIHLTRLGGREPVFEFQKRSIEIFDKLESEMKIDMIKSFNSIDDNN
ncbi:accessory Sec system translocase SecA2, partial [candidate division KSB1 bacterium]|nr:accessory Sec system translocase SecA2 [candidate division KSB1 bacterium]